MEKRRFGRTNHMSTIAIFGCAALGKVTQEETDETMEKVLAAGVNHIDIAPSYGDAELRMAPWMPKIRKQMFLGCKTTKRTRDEAKRELHQSLERLGVDYFDLYQFHAVTSFEELDMIFSKGGAFEAFIEAKEQGLTRYIGITGHGVLAPAVYLEALKRFDFDSVLFPVNYVQYTSPEYRKNAEELIRVCNQRDVGIMTIKSVYKARWQEGVRPKYSPWYEPFHDPEQIQKAVNFVLSQKVTGICTVGDITVLPLVLAACQNFKPMSPEEQEALIESARTREPLFA